MRTVLFKIVLAVSVLALAVMACSVATPGGSAVPTDKPAPTADIGGGDSGNTNSGGDVTPPTSVPPSNNGRPLLNDDFRGPDSNWGTGTDADSAVEYVNDALQFIIFTTNLIVYSGPNDTDYENIHIEVTAANTSTDPNAAFGVMCNQQFMDDEFYYAYITASGDYGIVKSMFVEDNVDLATGYSELIPQNASSYQIGLDCGNGAITLYVNGQMIDTVTDASYTTGHVGLLTFSGKTASGVSVSFDDFIITALP